MAGRRLGQLRTGNAGWWRGGRGQSVVAGAFPPGGRVHRWRPSGEHSEWVCAVAGWSWIGGLGAVPGLGDEAATRGGVGWAGFRRRVPARALGGGSVGMTRLFVGCAGHLTRRDAPWHRGWRFWRPSGPVIIAEVLWWPSGRL